MEEFKRWPKSSVQKIELLSKFYNKKRIVVTGGASFIGSHLVDALLSLGAQVTVLDNFTSGKRENLNSKHPNLKIYKIDIESNHELSMYLTSVDYVFHLAAIHGGRGFIEKYPQKMMANLSIDTKVFNSAVEVGVERIIHASSACAYPISQQNNFESTRTLSEKFSGSMEYEGAFPDGAYGWTKLIGEYQLKQIIRGSETTGRSGRIFTAYGERENESHAAIALIAKALLNMEPFSIWGNGLQTRNFTYVTDTVVGLLLCGIDDSPEEFEIINIGTSKHISVNEFIQEIFRIIEWEPNNISRNLDKPQGVASRASDNQLIQAKFGWQPEVSISEGLERTIKWYSKHETKPKTIKELEDKLETR
jgi:UDP-glucose 4-epimerase